MDKMDMKLRLKVKVDIEIFSNGNVDLNISNGREIVDEAFDDTFITFCSDGPISFSDFLWFWDYMDRNCLSLSDEFDESNKDFKKLEYFRQRSLRFMSESNQTEGDSVKYV